VCSQPPSTDARLKTHHSLESRSTAKNRAMKLQMDSAKGRQLDTSQRLQCEQHLYLGRPGEIKTAKRPATEVSNKLRFFRTRKRRNVGVLKIRGFPVLRRSIYIFTRRLCRGQKRRKFDSASATDTAISSALSEQIHQIKRGGREVAQITPVEEDMTSYRFTTKVQRSDTRRLASS